MANSYEDRKNAGSNGRRDEIFLELSGGGRKPPVKRMSERVRSPRRDIPGEDESGNPKPLSF